MSTDEVGELAEAIAKAIDEHNRQNPGVEITDIFEAFCLILGRLEAMMNQPPKLRLVWSQPKCVT
jgi:hypothetical protein